MVLYRRLHVYVLFRFRSCWRRNLSICFSLTGDGWEIGIGHARAVGWHSDRKVMRNRGGRRKAFITGRIGVGWRDVWLLWHRNWCASASALRRSPGTSFPSVAGTLTLHCFCGDLAGSATLAPFQPGPILPLFTAQELRKADSAHSGQHGPSETRSAGVADWAGASSQFLG